MAKETLRNEWVKCGKQCSGCPHGPYWYAYWREGKKVRKRYIGKGDPRSHGDDDQADEKQQTPPPRPHRFDAIFDDRRASRSLATEIMGLPYAATLDEVRARYRDLAKIHHPDRNPDADAVVFLRIQAAYGYLGRMMS